MRIYNKKSRKVLVICFLGTDGSGKSTVIDSISKILKPKYFHNVNYEHLRPNYLPSISNLFGPKKLDNEINSNPHGSTTSNYFGSFFRWIYYFIDYTLGYLIKVYFNRDIESSIWIFDRYYYDYFIDPKRSRIKLPFWILKLGQLIIPEPDIIFCLGTDPKTIYSRKPEIPMKEVIRQVNDLYEFCDKNKRAYWIDTGCSIKNSVNETVAIILNKD